MAKYRFNGKSRTYDPSRRIESTHRASPIRTYVYDQLGLSKPGFWADWRRRTIKAQANEDLPDDEQAEKSDLPTNDNDLEMPTVEKGNPKKFKNMEFMQEAQAEAPKQRKWVDWYSKPMGKMMQASADKIWKGNPLWTSTSSLNLMSMQTAVFDERVAEASRAGENVFAAIVRLSAESHKWEAKVRADKPFGSLGETNFDKMLRLLQTRPHTVKPAPDYTVKYTSVSSGGSTVAKAAPPETTQGNLNVGQNGYVSTVMQKKPPVQMGITALKSKPLAPAGINRGAIATKPMAGGSLQGAKGGLAH